MFKIEYKNAYLLIFACYIQINSYKCISNRYLEIFQQKWCCFMINGVRYYQKTLLFWHLRPRGVTENTFLKSHPVPPLSPIDLFHRRPTQLITGDVSSASILTKTHPRQRNKSNLVRRKQNLSVRCTLFHFLIGYFCEVTLFSGQKDSSVA